MYIYRMGFRAWWYSSSSESQWLEPTHATTAYSGFPADTDSLMERLPPDQRLISTGGFGCADEPVGSTTLVWLDERRGWAGAEVVSTIIVMMLSWFVGKLVRASRINLGEALR